MFFCLFLITSMIIMLIIVATNCENKLDCMVLLLLSVLILSLGVCLMQNWNGICKNILFVIIILIFIFLVVLIVTIIYQEKFCNIYTTDKISLTKEEVEKLAIVSQKNPSIQKDKEIVVVLNNIEILKNSMFRDKNLDKVKKIYFLSSHPVIDSQLYKKIKDRVVFNADNFPCLVVEHYYIIGDLPGVTTWDWSKSDKLVMTAKSATEQEWTYKATETKTIEFKFTNDPSWDGTINAGAASDDPGVQDVKLGTAYTMTLGGGSKNLKLAVTKEKEYVFVLNVADTSKPTVTVTEK